MRRNTGWSALLLAAGVALAPKGAWAQTGEDPNGYGSVPYLVLPQASPIFRGQMGVDKQEDPTIPLPVGHPRMDVVGGIYFATEFAMYRQTNPLGHQLVAVRGFTDVDGAVTGDLNGTVVNTDTQPPFIIRGPLVPGNFLGSGAPALFTDDVRGQESFQPGYKITFGYRFDNGTALEASWMSLQKVTYAANASLIPTNFAGLAAGPLLANSFVSALFFNLPPEFAGANQKVALGNPGSVYGIFNGDNNMSESFRQFFQQFDIRGRVPWYQDDCTRIYGYGGGRFAWIWEQYQLRAVSSDFLGDSTPEDVGVYENTVSNRMYGAFGGIGAERYLGYGFGIGLEAEAAFLLDIVKERAQVQNGDRNSSVRNVPFVIIKKSATDFSPVGEFAANAQLYWYPWEGVQLKAGYNLMTFLNTVAMETPIAFDARNFDPNWQNKAIRFLDGFNAGIGFIF
jgi:Legionella pneumophila major outer membrane protein precursor